MLCGHVHKTGENELLEKCSCELRESYKAGVGTHMVNAVQIYNIGCMMP